MNFGPPQIIHLHLHGTLSYKGHLCCPKVQSLGFAPTAPKYSLSREMQRRKLGVAVWARKLWTAPDLYPHIWGLGSCRGSAQTLVLAPSIFFGIPPSRLRHGLHLMLFCCYCQVLTSISPSSQRRSEGLGRVTWAFSRDHE